MRTLRILLIERSAARRRELRTALESAPDLCVIEELSDARSAFSIVMSRSPDLILLDTGLLDSVGLGAIELIMAERPTPILLLASGPPGAEDPAVQHARRQGALHVEVLPFSPAPAPADYARLLPLIRRVAAVPVVRHIRSRTPPEMPAMAYDTPSLTQLARATSLPRSTRRIEVIGLGASIGGPTVLTEILVQLPRPLPVSIAVVQHLPPEFARPFAEYLQGRTGLPTQVVSETVPLAPGVVYLPADDRHLVITGPGRIGVSNDPPVSGHRPSVDRLFQSLAVHYGGAAVGVLLTGLGRDGSEGLMELRRRHGTTFAQDATTATVDGMPRAARELGAAMWVLSPLAIAQALRRLCSEERS